VPIFIGRGAQFYDFLRYSRPAFALFRIEPPTVESGVAAVADLPPLIAIVYHDRINFGESIHRNSIALLQRQAISQ
jgi:hypothetical protein